MGDFVLTLPVFDALKVHFPHAQLDVLGYPGIAAMAQWGGWVSHVYSIEQAALATFFTAASPLDREWSDRFASYDLIVSYCFDPEGVFHQRLREVNRATLVRGIHRPDENASIHATQALLSALAQIGIVNPDPEPRLTVPDTVRTGLDAGCWLAVHPGSGSTQKNWAIECWLSLLRKILDSTAWNLLVVGGESDEKRIEALQCGLNSKRIVYAVNEPLARVAVCLKQCSLYLGHDSGISHFAAALGLKGIVLWGPSNRLVWHPMSQRFDIIDSPEGLAQLAVDEVYRHVVASIERGSMG